MADVTYIPEGNSQGNNILPWMLASNGGFGGMNNAWPWLLAGNGGGFGGFGGWGGGILGFFLGLLFGNGWGGFGNGFGGFGGGNGAGFLSNQIDNNAGRELLMNAINSNGEASRAAISNLATMLGQDYTQVSAAVAALQNGLNSLALQQAVSVPQLINSIQAGDSALMSKLCDCCCENRLLTTQQGYEAQIRTIEQTNQLGSQADRNTASVVGAINDLKATTISEFCAARERDMQSKIDTQADIITQLRNQVSNDKQTEAFNAAFSVLNQKVTDLAARQPNTVPVQWPALTAVNTTPYVNGGFYGGWGNNGGNYYGPGWGFGFNNGFGF